VIYPLSFENKIGFDRIRSFLAEGCLCELGRELSEKMTFINTYEKLSAELAITQELKQILELEENFPQDNYLDGRLNLQKMRIDGSVPEVIDLVVIRKSLGAIMQIVKFLLVQERKVKYPLLCSEAGNVATFPEILREIDRIVDPAGKVKDSASSELRDIRLSIKQKQTEVNRKLQTVLRQAKADGLADDDAEITFRNNRPVIPVSAANKRKLGGLIHDESSTGKTAFVEPAIVVELNNQVREFEMAELREIRRILGAFADFIRPDVDSIANSYFFLARIDFLRSKARFAQRVKGIMPILTPKQEFNWKKAVHPLLFLLHSKEKKEIIPLDIHLNKEGRILLISGPNAGGKSVCLKTVGLLQYMLQCGMLVPMSENSEAGIFNSMFIDIGDEQSIDNDLSTYSGHLENMKYFLKHSDNKTLILIDEFGTGTEPVLGGAIAEAVLEELNRKEVYAVITTHYANLKHYASGTTGLVNGAMLFDVQSIKPLYQLSIGRPGSSFAIDIARKIGLPEEILSSATSKIGEEHFNYDKHLREIARDKSYWETKRQKIRKVEKTLDDLYGKYGQELEDIQNERKKLISEAKHEAQRVLKDANAVIERTIREIKEKNAEKEQTKQLRQDLEAFKNKVSLDFPADDKIEKKIKEITHAGKNLVNHSPVLKESKVTTKKKEKPVTIQIGDMVNLKGMETPGEVIKLEGKTATIAFGNILSTIEIGKIERSETQEKPKVSRGVKISQEIRDKKMNFRSEIDVRGKRGDEALMVIQQFIDDAVMAGNSQISILHGKGNGILRQLIRDYLSTLNFVKTVSDAHADRGGAGITNVIFDM
jgi:DNA mismatch repair protein MutS2